MAMKRYNTFEDWLGEIENYGTRRERFMNAFANHAEVELWLQAAWRCARDELNDREEALENFERVLKEQYPEMYGNVYCGMWVGPGWMDIIDALSRNIYRYVESNNSRRQWLLANNPDHEKIPDHIDMPTVAQIKEKFGELRFYIDGGDAYIRGLISMAEEWANGVCEECGEPGRLRHGGWMKTLCDKHEEERQANMKARNVNY